MVFFGNFHVFLYLELFLLIHIQNIQWLKNGIQWKEFSIFFNDNQKNNFYVPDK